MFFVQVKLDSTASSEARGKAAYVTKAMEKKEFMHVLAFLLDTVAVLSKLSLLLQKQDCTVASLNCMIGATKTGLHKLKEK